MDWRSRIVADPDVLVGKPVIKGTRIAVELVMDDIHACLAYAREVIRSERMFAVKS